MTAIRIAVISDQHYFTTLEKGASAPSHIRLAADSAASCPARNLKELIAKDGLRANIVACPGDITFQADMGGIDAAWKDLIEIQRLLEAKHLAVATGNHDVASRQEVTAETDDPIEHLKNLTPRYPCATTDEDMFSYFGANVLKLQTDSCRVVILNSCNNHMTGKAAAYERGNYSKSMDRALEQAIGNTRSSELGIVICHHHPMLHSEHDLGTSDVMTRGDQLLAALNKTGPWLVIHGHKHHGSIKYAAGGAGSPVVFSAGSLSIAHHESGGGLSNQFYIIDVEVKHGRVIGTVEAWTWTATTKWEHSRWTEEIPNRSGFGCHKTVEELADEVVAALRANPTLSWLNLVGKVPDLNYVLASDMKLLVDHLSRTHQIELEFDRNNEPSTIGRSRT